MTRNNKFRALAVSAAAVIAFALGAGSFSAAAASADDVSGDQNETTTSQGTGSQTEGQETPGSQTDGNEDGNTETGDETEPGTGDDQQQDGTEDNPGEGNPDGDETADPTVTLEWYPVEDGNVSDQPADLSNGPTNVTDYRVDVIVNDPAFAEKMQAIAEAEESGNDAVAAEAGDTAIALTVDDGDDATEPVVYSAEYSAFVQSKDDDGTDIPHQYELAVDEDTDNRLKVEFPEDTTYTLSLSAYMNMEDSQSEGWPQLTTGLGDSNQLHVDTAAPSVTATISRNGSSWSKKNSNWVSQDEQSITFTVSGASDFNVLDADKKPVELEPNGNDKWTWRLTPGNDYYLKQYHVNATDQAGNTFNKPVADLLPGKPTRISILSDEQVAGELRIISESAENDYYRNVTGFSYKYKNPNSWWIPIAIEGLGDSQMMTLTHGGESVNMDCEYADGTISCMIADGTELADGSYTVAINRKLAKNQQTFTVDNTAPTVDNVKYVADRDNDLQNGGEVLAFNSLDSREQAKRSLTFSVNESGVGFDKDDVTISGTYEDLDGNEHDLQDAYEVDVRPNHQVEVTFTKPGSYDFGNIKIEVKDNLENGSGSQTIADITGSENLPSPLTITNSADESQITSTFKVTATNAPVADGGGLQWYNAEPTVSVKIGRNNPTLTARILKALKDKALKDDDTVVFASTHNGENQADVTFKNLKVSADGVVSFTLDGDGEYSYSVPDASNTAVRRLFGQFETPEIEFGVDTQQPTIVSVTGGSANTSYDDKPVYAAVGDQTLTVNVRDFFKGSDSSTEYTSGLKTVTVDIPAATDLNGKQLKDATTETLEIDGNGNGTITLPAEGYYDLSKVTIHAADLVDNGESRAVTGVDMTVDMQAVASIAPGAPAVASVTLTDKADDARKQVHQGYYRGHNGVDATYTVTDMWFPLAQNAASVNGEDLLSGSSVAQSASDRLAALKVTDDWQKSGEYTWTITKPVLLDGHDQAAEGVYDLDIHYKGLHDTMANAKVDDGFLMDGTHFVIDWTAPTIGDVSFATMDTNWRGLLFSESQTVTLSGISDNIAGVRADSKQFATVDGNGNVSGPAVSYDAHISGASLGSDSLTYDAANGTLSFSMDADSFRLNAKGTALAISDEAGNYVSTGDFSGLPVFADNGIETLVIDNVAPTISVVYDNNDVRNGKYYNAHRTGTLTLTDSNLDLIAGRDADRTVLTVTVDGATDRTVTLGSLSAGDDGRTYTASFSAASDGDWVIDAGFADVVPTHARVSFHDEFTVDTVAPVLEMTFDNNSVANGMYYNAPRTATVTQTERNMSESESVVTTTARDDAGAEQAAPGASGWVRAGGERESTQWTNTVPFTGEMHYTISATATDLAGNVAQEVSSPEFVIDLTDPEITIDRVEDQTAYAGTVAPLIDFSDTNIDPDDVSYTITGVHRGELRDRNMPANTVTETDNTRTIDFADFERKTDIDDVYTIKATATDMAGNTFEAEKTFSVNRFGSTYTFDAGTQNLRGVYLKKSQDVRVTEINVSGLDPTLSQIVVAKDDNAVTLHAGDYTTTPGDVQGWTETVYTIPAKNFADDGYYRVQVQSVDKAGNLSQNTMDEKNADRTGNAEVNFAVDSTAPTASLLGVESGAVYYDQQGRDVGIDSKDNMGLMRTELYVDGSKVQEWKGEESLESTPQYVLAAGDGAREIVVRTTDMAGNQATSTYDNVYVASNWWQYAIHTAWIRNTMIFAAILIVAAIAVAVALLVQRSRRNRFSYGVNPLK